MRFIHTIICSWAVLCLRDDQAESKKDLAFINEVISNLSNERDGSLRS